MTSFRSQLSHEEIQDYTYRFLGRFFIAFAKVELNLSLNVGGEGKFSAKLDRFLETCITRHEGCDTRLSMIFSWYMAADSIREIRNRFAHGRWAFDVRAQEVIHVAGYPPAAPDERRYQLVELDSMVMGIESLSEELCRLV